MNVVGVHVERCRPVRCAATALKHSSAALPGGHEVQCYITAVPDWPSYGVHGCEGPACKEPGGRIGCMGRGSLDSCITLVSVLADSAVTANVLSIVARHSV
jgi:hypothetical protein